MEMDLSGDMKGWMEWVEHIGHQTFCEEWLIAALFPPQVDHVLYDRGHPSTI